MPSDSTTDTPKSRPSSPLLRSTGSQGSSSSDDGSPSTGEGVDRRIEKKTWTPKRIGLLVAAVLVVGVVGYAVWSTATGGKALNVEREKLTVSTVERGPFQEFIAVTGSVIPERTVFLDAIEGGRIEEIFVQEGAMVDAGDELLRLSNNDLRLRLLDSQAQLAEQESNMEQLKLSMEQQSLNLQQQIAQMEYQIKLLQRQHDRQERLYNRELIAQEDYLNTRDELVYQRRRLGLTRAAFQQDSLAQRSRLAQMSSTEERLQRSYEALQASIANLTVRAPISGQLTALNGEIGQIINSGTRIGQVDKIDSYKVRAQIDEFYIERVRRGQAATTQPIGGTEHVLSVTRVYPEVENGSFEVDLTFDEEAPSGIRRGQSVRLKLELGSPEEALLLSRGGFYQSTGGNWAYVLNEDDEAVRQPIRLGRQNPNKFEVLGGLQPGDRVVTSSYETFGDADRLVIE